MYYKYVHGHVVQKFDINGKCVDQEFIGEDVEYENQLGESIDPDDMIVELVDQPCLMIQPNQPKLVDGMNRMDWGLYQDYIGGKLSDKP